MKNDYLSKKKMKVRLLYFGVTRDYANRDEESMELNSDQSVLALKKNLMLLYPELAQMNSFAMAVNESYATDEVILKEGDTIAIIPPVSGG